MKNIMQCKVVTFLLLVGLMGSAFAIRLGNAARTEGLSVDEETYFTLAKQLQDDWHNYNTVEYAKFVEAERGKPLPRYFHEPLFKYPPFFCLFVSWVFHFSGVTLTAAASVATLFGVLLIPLGFLMGYLSSASVGVGLLAAVVFWLEPVQVICSQKIWMDTMMSFFMTLAVSLFAVGVSDRRRDSSFILAGFVAGLAVLTKYPGLLAVAIMAVAARVVAPELFRNRKFVIGLLIPFVMLIPWLYWNFEVYGVSSLGAQVGLPGSFLRDVWLGFLVVGIQILLVRNRGKLQALVTDGLREMSLKPDDLIVKALVPILFLLLFWPSLIDSVRLDVLPKSSWRPGLFTQENCLFYIGKLLEFSFLYVFAVLSFLRPKGAGAKEEVRQIFKIAAVLLVLFFSTWGNYQSRYILPAIPFLLLLACGEWVTLFRQTQRETRPSRKMLWRGLLLVSLFLALGKMLVIDLNIAFPNAMCYF